MLITTRTRDRRVWDPLDWCEARSVGMLSNADGAAMLRDLTDDRAGDEADAKQLSHRLGGLPLALRLAGRYLATTNQVPLHDDVTSYAAYLAKLERTGPVPLMPASDSIDPAPDRRAIDRTWMLSLTLLESRGHPAAKPLLRVLAMMADAKIPYPLILDASILSSSKAFKDCDIRELLQALDSLALIDFTSDGGNHNPALKLHQMIRDTIRHELTLSREAAVGTGQLAIRLIAQTVSRPEVHNPDDPRCWPAWSTLAPHPPGLFATARALPGMPNGLLVSAADSAAATARYLAAIGLFDAAKEQVDDIVAAYEQLLGPYDPKTLEARCNAARWIGEAGDRATARDRFHTLVEECERVHGSEAPVTLGLRGHLAHWTGWAGDAKRARDMCAELLRHREQHLGTRHPETLSLRSSLAHWTGLSNDAKRARDEYEAVAHLWEKVSGPEDRATLNARSGLARWTGEAGDRASAVELYRELVRDIQRICGPEHHDTLNELAELAHWTGKAGDPVSAVEQYRSLLPLRERICGPTHPETEETRARLAYWQQQTTASRPRPEPDSAAMPTT
jgi:hypothetical protein